MFAGNTTNKMQVLVHAESEGSVSDWQGFGRELSRTGVAGDCKSERTVVIDMDLKTFFDVVHHDRLMYRLAETIGDKTLLKLIRKYLQSGIMVDGIVSQRTEGTPQGSPLSPLLSNIVVDELDKEPEYRGHKFVRYADGCNIYVRSQAAGERVMKVDG